MKRRRSPPPPPVVVVKPSRRSTTAPAAPPRPLPPDGRIRVLRDDAPPRPPPSQSKTAWLQAEIALWAARLRLANDPAVMHGAAEKLAQRDQAESAMVSILALPDHPLGSGYFIVAGMGAFHRLGLALRALFTAINFVRPSQAMDRWPSSLRPFIKNMRKD
jgi:hypothetical protein